MLKQNKKTNSAPNLTGKEYGKIISKAEKLRKDKQVKQAEQAYWQAIKTGEASSDWQENGPHAKPYKKLAKLYYHTKRDEQALQVIDRYLKLARQYKKDLTNLKQLRKRLAQEDFRRLVNKYSS